MHGLALCTHVAGCVPGLVRSTRACSSRTVHSIKLTAARTDLQRALEILSATRRSRFSSIVPAWLALDGDSGTLQIVEERGNVSASLPAVGSWPPAGATVDLLMLKRAVGACLGETVDLHAAADSVMVFDGHWHARLKLLRFGPESGRPSGPGDPLAPLPLFEWADRRR